MNTTITLIRRAALLLLLLPLTSYFSPLLAQGTAFTYQGRLNTNGASYSGSAEFQFTLWDAPSGGNAVATNNAASVVASVAGGLFTVTLDFGSNPFNGQPRFLQTDVRTTIGPFTPLTPRQPLTPAPYAIFAGSVPNGAVDTPQLAAGAVTSAKVADGTLQPADLNLDVFNRTFWRAEGNSNTVTGTHFIGTTDDQPLDMRVNNVRVMRYRLNTDASGSYTNAPNVIGGSSVNSALTTVVGATISGGGGNITNIGSGGFLDSPNRVTANFGTIGGGLLNTASGANATVSGGDFNTASGDNATVSGGDFNTASDTDATVSGGGFNTASGFEATVAGGYNNTASGDYATIGGGLENVAAGNTSFAAGETAHANHRNSFVWSDGSASTTSAIPNSVTMRASGGFRFFTGDTAVGARLAAGDTAWSSICDRNEKKNFRPVDTEGVLEKLATTPVQSWNYKWEADTNTPHLGPVAQDFKAAFYPGRDDKSISTLEFDGVELAAIQGLNEKVEVRSEKVEVRMQKSESDIQKLTDELKRRDAENAALKRRLERLERLLEHENTDSSFP